MLFLMMAQLPVEPLGEIDCSKNPVVQIEATHCAWRDHQAADAEMNAQWMRTLAYAREKDVRSKEQPDVSRDKRPSYSTVLLKSQRTWLAYRDAQCASEGYYGRGGTIEPMLVNMCLARVTRERITQLRELWRR
jgi:uncharacterized protein YecT (DUF1311 family)